MILASHSNVRQSSRGMELMFDHDIITGGNTPQHNHAGARNTDSLFNTNINGKLDGITRTLVEPASGTTVPANTWFRCVYRFVFPAAATQEGYIYPAIRSFVYGTVLSTAVNGEVHGWMRRAKVEKGNRATDWTPAPEDVEAATAAAQAAADRALSSTEVIVGTQTAATGAWKGAASFSQLRDGQVILYWLPVAGSGNATLELALAGGGTTGAKNVYIDGTTRCTTHISAGNMAQMVYRENVSIGGTAYTGWWVSRARNDNNYDRVRMNNAILAKTAILASRIIVSDADGYFHLESGCSFDINKPILWAASAISANGTGTNNYLSISNCTLRNNTDAGWTATQYTTLYLAGTLAGNTYTVASTDWLTTAPADETLTYISLGYMYSTYQIFLYPEHPMFRLVDGVLTAVSQIAYEAQLSADAAQASANTAQETASEALEAAQETRALVRVENDGLHVKGYQLDAEGARVLTGGEVLVSADGMHVIVGGQVYSCFASDYVEFGNYQLRRVAGGLAFKLRKDS